MKIAIIGKANPCFTYEEWESRLRTNVEVENVAQINITIGNGTLNQYVRRFARSHNVTVKEFAPDIVAYGDDAKRRRNVALVEDTDLIVGFLPEGSSKESWIYRPGIPRKKNTVVIYCQNNQTTKQMDLRNVISRNPSNEIESISPDELITVEEEANLVRKIRNGEGDADVAKEKLMYASQRFVRSIARKYVSPNFTFEELVAEGNKGLEAAIAKYDETRGFKFISYAVWWIQQSILQAITHKTNEESAESTH